MLEHMKLWEQCGCGHVRVEYGHSKEANLSAQALLVAQIKALLPPFPPTGIQPSSVDLVTTAIRVQRGCGHVRVEYGHSKEANLSAQQAFLVVVHTKALLSLFLPTGIQPS
jgi:hypothetical protein